MSETITITLGGRVFTIRPLTLRQIRDLGVGLVKAAARPTDAAAAEREAYDRMVETVAGGLARDYPEITAEALLDMEVSLAELQRARLAVLEHSGLIESKGEAAAGASTGATSMAG